MKKTVEELSEIVERFAEKISRIPDDQFSVKPLPNKWSKKEVLGHLIDSAQNNLRRFICGQYESTPPKIIYEQDFWVKASNYQAFKKEKVIFAWQLINMQIEETLKSMPADSCNLLCDTGKDSVQVRTLQWLAEDYLLHMKHHLNQIIPGSFDVVYG